MTENAVTYEPDNSLKKGYSQIFKEIFDEIKKNRWLIYQLFKRDFVASYRQSLFGILWSFLIPIVSVISLVVLSQSGLFNVGDVKVPYPVYALIGLLFWQLFSTGVVSCSGALVSAGSMIAKINFSKKALVLASMGRTFIAFIIQLALTVVVFVYFAIYQGVIPNIATLLVPIFILPLLLITLGLGFVLSVLNGFVRDFGNLVLLGTTFLLVLTPVMYAMPTTGILPQLTTYNPLYYLVSLPRDLILTGTSNLWVGFLISSVLSVLAFVFGLVTFHLTETRLAERI